MYFKNIYFFHFIFIEYVHAIYICIIKLYNWYIKYYAIAFLRVIHVYSYGSEFLYTAAFFAYIWALLYLHFC